VQSHKRSAPLFAALLGTLTGVLGVLFLFNNLIGTQISNTLWADEYDARLIYWILEWGFRVLWQQGDPASFWNANSFFPHTGTLAFSDSLIAAQIFYIPLRLIGAAPLTALYGTLASACIVGATFSALLLWRAGIHSHSVRTVIVAAAHFSPCVFNFTLHYQLFGVQFAIPFLIAIWGFYRNAAWFEWNTALIFGALSVCFAAYFAPMLTSILFILILLWGVCTIRHLRLPTVLHGPNQRCLAPKFVLAACVGIAVYYVQLAPYQRLFNSGVIAQSDSDPIIEQRQLSARPSSLLRERSPALHWYKPWSRARATERAYFPGYMLLLLGLGGAAVGIIRKDSSALARSSARFGGALLFSAVLLSLGPRLAGHPQIVLPFDYLSHIIPGLSNIRAPGRFGMLAGLALAMLSLPLLELLDRNAKAKYLVVALPILITIECWPSIQTYPLWRSDPKLYRMLATMIPPQSPLIELPVAGREPLNNVKYAVQQLQGSTLHWGRLVVGYGAAETAELRDLRMIDRDVQRGKIGVGALVDFARSLGVRYLVVRYADYQPLVRARWVAWYGKFGNGKRADRKAQEDPGSAAKLFRDKRVMIVRLGE